ncbi:MAG: hypothetical protein HQL43_00475 [Alphaproteobacteria bacterium]|nr:hypothetical protein [Alphaproteobacteria bacterium]
MLIALGFKSIEGPWGGGIKFAQSLASRLDLEGIARTNSLSRNVDLILLTDPRRGGLSANYNDADIFRSLLFSNPNALVVHRVNECDERKGTNYVNRDLRRAALISDHSVFISSWLRDLHLGHGWPCESVSVILNGADKAVFYPDINNVWNPATPMRLVTHHWGTGWLKGFDIYTQIDRLLDDASWRDKIMFTYIGRLPESVHFNNISVIEPLSGLHLSDELRKHHVYLTASQNEPAGMHHVEGAMCGLPLMYRESGALPEYCCEFGLSIAPDNLAARLNEMREKYFFFKNLMPRYPNSSEQMACQYVDLFKRLTRDREILLKHRRRTRMLRWLWQRYAN